MDEPFKNRIPVPYSPLDLLDVSTIGLQRQTFCRFISPVQVPRVGVSDADVLLREKLVFVSFLLIRGCCARVGFLVRLCLCLSHPPGVALSSILCCGGIFQLVFRSFSERIFPYVAVDLVCMWEVSSDIPIWPS